MPMMSLQSLDLKEKRVLLRVDFNVPLDKNGQITDDTRIRQALPSIEYLIKQRSKVILMSHLGRPKGKPDPSLSLKPCALALSDLLKLDVKMAPDCVGQAVKTLVMSMQPGDVTLLENLRFHDEEEHPTEAFAQALAELGEIYIDDAFATAHRKHTSTYLLPSLFPGKAAGGFLMEKEVNHLSPLILQPKRPFYAILGGAKIESKLGVLDALLPKIDGLFIGGGMAFTFMKASGIPIGNSLCDDHLLDEARRIMLNCQEKAIKFWLPKDVLIGRGFTDDAEFKTVPAKDGLPDGWQGMDIGEETVKEWTEALKSAATVFWNGPMGIFEFEEFAHGTKGIAQALGALDADTIVGGGDSVAAVNQLGLSKNFTHISTGGGASLEFIEHGHLPGIDILS
ncbi:MAG: phosphoglycerate kinase [Chlamydiales bacterium]|nr:phosphoglycerate kinase [Chlamydiales bacterium]